MFAYTKLMQAMAAAGVVSATDPYFNLTTLLLNTSSTNGAQNNTFLDSSTNNFTITRNGNTTQGTFTPFSQTGWSNYFSASPFLSVASNTAFDFGSGDATQEMWIYPTAASQTGGLFDKRSTGSNYSQFPQITIESGVLKVYVSYTGSSWAVQITGATPTPNTWTHIALVRSGNTWTLYVNGAVSGTPVTASGSVYASSNSLCIGAAATDGGNPYTGYISNVRIVKGTAVYTSAFTPSTTPLTAVSGTSLLTCQSNRFADSSTNAFAITLNGTPSVQAFSPFAPTIAYDTAVVGGSGYFDGTGDYLVTPSSASVSSTLLASDFTIECWLYLTTYPGGGAPIWTNSTSNSDGFSSVYVTSTGTVALGKVGVNEVASTATVVRNAWNHFATVRSGSTVYLYLNGAQIASGAASTYLDTSTAKPLQIGQSNQSTPSALTGYISGYRAVSSALYTGSTYTIPTSVPTAISGTTLLLNFTNGGIYDSAAKNDLETVGNAQVSTTQAKWGTTSLYCPSTNGNYLVSPPNQQNFLFGTGNFTVEAWVYPTAFTNSAAGLIGYGLSGGYVDWNLEINTSGTVLYIDNDAGRFSSSSNLSTNAWTHIAIVRTNTAVTMYFNGTSVGSYSTINNISGSSTSARLYVGTGAQAPGSRQFIGYIDDPRITKGYARYTANFTPPTAAFPLQ
jgi:hypothetical protein